MTLLDDALSYRRMGLSVVPISKGTKAPPRNYSWTDAQKTLPTEEKIRSDFSGDVGIGIVTGRVSGVVVLDIDPSRCDLSTKEYINQELLPGGLFFGSPVVRTGGGGYHVYFKAPDDPLLNRVNVRPGLDIRAENGLVIAPPTIHHSGVAYKWVYEFDRAALKALPEEFATKVQEQTSEKKHWIEEALGGVPSGGRNDTCARLAGYFLGKNVPPDIVASILNSSFGSRCSPPMSQSEVERTVYSVAKKVKTKPTATFGVTHINDFMAAHAESVVSWAIQEWLPEGAVTFLVAPPGTYKTWLLLDLALSLSTGSPFLGKYPVQIKGPVIVVQQEDHKSGIASRLSQIWRSRLPITMPKEIGDSMVLPDANVPIWVHETRSLRLDSDESINALGAQVEKLRPVAVLIDPLYSTLSTDDYMASAAEQMLGLKTLRDQFNCAFVIAHHTRKKQDEGRLGAWGSQFLNAFIETGWQIRRADDSDIITVTRHHKVSAPLPPITLEWEIKDDDYSVRVAGIDVIGDVTQAILTMLAAKSCTVQEIADATKVHRSTISRRLNGMMKDGLVQKEGMQWCLT